MFNGTLTTEELCDEAFDGNSIEPSVAKAAIEQFMKAVQRNVLKGFRCKLGVDFLTIYPNLSLKVKDYTDKDGNLVVATADMLNASNAKSRLGCTVHPKFSQKFASDVSWQKVDGQGNEVEEDDITQGNGNVEGGGDNSGDNGGGDNNNGGEHSLGD